MSKILIGYFELTSGGFVIVCDLDAWPERSYRPHGITPRPLYVRAATEDEIEKHLNGKRRACSHRAKTLDQLLNAEREVLPVEVYARVEAALREAL
jgi:hypothetical protein